MYILGYFLPWRLTTFPGMFIPLLTLGLVYFLPETPVWLLKRYLYIYSTKDTPC